MTGWKGDWCMSRVNGQMEVDWRAKRALDGEVNGNLCIATHARIWYISQCTYMCRMFITRDCTEDFSEKEMVVLENKPWRLLG